MMGAAAGGAAGGLDEVCVGMKDELTCWGFSQGWGASGIPFPLGP